MTNTPAPLSRPTKKPETRPDRPFVRQKLPWFLAGGAFVIYLLTLHHWIAFSSLFEISRACDWIWQPDLSGPVAWVVAAIFRVVPLAARPMALNVFAAACGAVTLGLLARSVALWPHDRTHEQRQRERAPFWFLTIKTAWLPPVLAVLVCGLQLTFWEFATKSGSASPPWGSGFAMLDVLMFAYIIRALLEFRISQKESWLFKAALVYGLAMTNNWAMLLFLPLFLGALIWIRGLAFFNITFLVRMFLWGLVGLSFYLILPIIQSSTDIARVPFWTRLRQELAVQKSIISTCYTLFNNNRQEQLVLALTSLVPFLLISIRWAAYFGDTSKLGVALTTWAFHIVHAAFLVVGLWMALDPPFGTRSHALSQAFGLPFLTLSYLTALVIGYIAGYFLVIFKPPEQPKRVPPLSLFISRVITGCVWLLAIVTPVLLVAKNLPYIRESNGGLVREYARQMAQSLPATNVVVLSDDARRSALLRGEAVAEHRAGNMLPIESRPLTYPDYQRFIKRHFPQLWPFEVAKEGSPPVADIYLIGLIEKLAATNAIYYLHPSFGYYFEVFYEVPHGIDYELRRTPPNTLEEVPLTPEVKQENLAFWSHAYQNIVPEIGRAVDETPKYNSPLGKVFKFLRIKPEANRELSLLGSFYSRSLDYWGVKLQRNGNLKDAATAFDAAMKLNSDNIVAKVNLQCNEDLLAGRKITTNNLSSNLADDFGKYRGWDDVMSENGPFDQPQFCFLEGMTLKRSSLLRQAAQEFARSAQLEPDNLLSRLWLADLNVEAGLSDKAISIIRGVRADAAKLGVSQTNQNEVLFVEMSAHLAKHDLKSAEQGLESAVAAAPQDISIYEVGKQLYMKYGYFTNVLDIVSREYKLNPTNTDLLLTKGYAYQKLGNYDGAIQTFTSVLNTETNAASPLHNYALLDRAACYVESGKLDEGKGDYETLEQAFPKSADVKRGLGEIAYRKKDTNAAVRYFQLYLANAPTNTPDARSVREKLKEIRPGYPQIQ